MKVWNLHNRMSISQLGCRRFLKNFLICSTILNLPMVIDKFPLTLVTRSHWELVNYRRFLTSLVVNWLSVAFCYRSQKLFSQPSHGKNRYRNPLLLFTFSRRKASSRSFCRVKQNGIKWDEKLSIKSCLLSSDPGDRKLFGSRKSRLILNFEFWYVF